MAVADPLFLVVAPSMIAVLVLLRSKTLTSQVTTIIETNHTISIPRDPLALSTDSILLAMDHTIIEMTAIHIRLNTYRYRSQRKEKELDPMMWERKHERRWLGRLWKGWRSGAGNVSSYAIALS